MAVSISEPEAAPAGLALPLGALGVLIFSASLPATRLAVLGGLDPAFIGVGRAAVAGLLAAVVLGVRGEMRVPRGTWPSLLLVSAGVVFGFPLLISLALARVPAVHASVLTGLLPAATAVMGVLRAGDRPGPGFWLAAGAGLLCVLAFAAAQGAGELDVADLLLLAAIALCGLGYAEGAVLSRTLGGPRVISLALLISLPVSVPLALLRLTPGTLHGTAAGWAGFAYVAVAASYLGFFAWYRGLALGGVARIGQLQLAQPVLSLLWAVLLLGETVSLQAAIAAAAVVACVVATQRTR